MIKKLLNKTRQMPVQVKASTAYVICSILQRCLSFVTLPLFTRLLTTEQYGQYSVYTSWSAVMSIFITLNLAFGSFNTAMVKFEKDRLGYVSAVQMVGVMMAGIFLAIYLPLQGTFNRLFEMPTVIVCVMIADLLGQLAVGCWNTLNRFQYKYKNVIALTLCVAVSSPTLAYFFVINSTEKGYARVLGYALVGIIAGAIIFASNLIRGRKPFAKEYWAYALRFNIPLIPYYLSQVVFNQSDRIMISHMAGTDKAGIYSVAYSLSLILTFVLNAINNSYVPWLYGKMREGTERENRSISNGIAMLMTTLLLGVIALAPEIIAIMAGEKYAEAVWVVPPVTMSLLLLFYSQLFINVQFFYEEKTMLVWGSVGAALLNVVLNWLLIPRFGYIAAGYTTLVSYIAFAVANYFTMSVVLKRQNKKNEAYDIRALAVIFLVFLALAFLAMALYRQPVIRFSIIGLTILMMAVKHKQVIAFVKKTILRK